MGPFPHDAPPPAISDENPMGTDGFEFVEYCHPEPEKLDRLFRQMGFEPVARHRSKDVTLYRQGDINFILNSEPESFAAICRAMAWVRKYGPCRLILMSSSKLSSVASRMSARTRGARPALFTSA